MFGSTGVGSVGAGPSCPVLSNSDVVPTGAIYRLIDGVKVYAVSPSKNNAFAIRSM